MRRILITLIHGYCFVFKYKPQSCRFYPSCSMYSMQAFKKYPFIKALFLSIARILRCNPFSQGGFDPLK
ncbi:MAG: membrane protein insertion efficiency factor YidD [Spirochaetes bacterium]|nr:membrane protein insertion efficiency factor YidD [Spirochaetota bacterium]